MPVGVDNGGVVRGVLVLNLKVVFAFPNRDRRWRFQSYVGTCSLLRSLVVGQGVPLWKSSFSQLRLVLTASCDVSDRCRLSSMMVSYATYWWVFDFVIQTRVERLAVIGSTWQSC